MRLMTRQTISGLAVEVSNGACVVPRFTAYTYIPCPSHRPSLVRLKFILAKDRLVAVSGEWLVKEQGVDVSDLETTAVTMLASASYNCRV